jgi:hypothetical protein
MEKSRALAACCDGLQAACLLVCGATEGARKSRMGVLAKLRWEASLTKERPVDGGARAHRHIQLVKGAVILNAR